jgi:hypothetical protein
MATVSLGVAVSFGVAGIGLADSTSTSQLGTFKLQSYNYKRMAEKDIVKDGNGTDVQATLYNQSSEATFEYIPQASSASGVAAAAVVPAVGDRITVTSTDAFQPISASTWFVWDDPQVAASNTGALRVTLHLKKWEGSGAIAAVST